MDPQIENEDKKLIEDVILDKLIVMFKKCYRPVATQEKAILLTTQEITDKFRDILPEVTDMEILKALEDLGYKTTMLKKATGFDIYWMLKEK